MQADWSDMPKVVCEGGCGRVGCILPMFCNVDGKMVTKSLCYECRDKLPPLTEAMWEAIRKINKVNDERHRAEMKEMGLEHLLDEVQSWKKK